MQFVPDLGELADSLDATAVAALVKGEEVGLRAWLCCPAPEAHPEVSQAHLTPVDSVEFRA